MRVSKRNPERSHTVPGSLELLAPGGDPDCVKAAILAGADAVYCGLAGFNARMRAGNIPLRQLPELVTLAHQHGVRIYLTLNTLILEHEFDAVIHLLAEAVRCGIDAVIVQDLGLLYLIGKLFPSLDLHASTQMTTHNTGQIALLAGAGVVRANLCRELSLSEIEELAAACGDLAVECEIFVHGAFCISFSGQCYLSSAMSGRSGNRGVCMQPCRRIREGQHGAVPDSAPLNLRDNSAFRRIDAIARAGVRSLKIEGRIKNYRYVHAAVSAWRRQIDRCLEGRPTLTEDRTLLEVFNRTFTSGYLDGNIARSMFIDSPRDQSLEELARIVAFTADTGVLQTDRPVQASPDTAVLIYTPAFRFVCTAVVERITRSHSCKIRITNKLKGRIRRGDIMYRQKDFGNPVELAARIQGMKAVKRSLFIRFFGSANTPLSAVFTADGDMCEARTDSVLVPAVHLTLDETTLSEKMSFGTDSGIELEGMDVSGLDSGLFIPLRELNGLRRSIIALASGKKEREVSLPADAMGPAEAGPPASVETAPFLAVLVEDGAEMKLRHGTTTKLIVELPVDCGTRIDHYADRMEKNREMIPWFPAILIGDHFTSAVALLENIRPGLIITDNLGIGTAAQKAGIPWIAGPLLNCVNSKSFLFLRRFGCSGAFVSHELGMEQMNAILPLHGFSRWFTVFTPLLLMNTRQCIVRNCIGCKKERFDEKCVGSCVRNATISGDGRYPLYVVKRAGFYNQVFNCRHYFNPELPFDVDRDNAVFLVDFRGIPSRSRICGQPADLLRDFESLIRGEPSALASLRSKVCSTTSGQYMRGI